MNWLSKDEVIELHDELLDLYGGKRGGGHRGDDFEGVEAAVQAVKNSYYEEAKELAAAYAVYIVQGHVFMDGNKRTGAASMLTFLHANSVITSISPARIPDLMIRLQLRAESGERTDRLIEWLSEYL